MKTQPIYLYDGLRTAVGSPYRGLKKFSAAQLGGFVINQIVKRNKFKRSDISGIVFGQAVAAGAGQNMARQAALLAGLPARTGAYTVNNVCGAGLQAVFNAVQSIKCGDADLVIAGGAESATHAPKLMFDADPKDVRQVDSMIYDGLWCHAANKHMGELAEWLSDKYDISREAQDRYALQTYKKAKAAYTSGKMATQIIGVNVTPQKVFQEDERALRRVDMEKLGLFPPSFRDDGTATVGNSSVPCDGAAALAVCGQKTADGLKAKPMARILGVTSVYDAPEKVFTSAVKAVKTCCDQSGIHAADVDYFQISEAFASQMLYTQKKLKIPEDKLNVWGGDLAWGHPLGAAGAINLVALLHILKREKGKIGVSAVCLGGGGALAVAVEAL